MNDLIPLSELPDNTRAVIAEIQAEQERLSELGLIVGTEIRVTMHGSGGSPIAFAVHGVTLALRKADCVHILVTPCEHEITYMLAGNPNTGKSTVFNALTGLHQHTGNWCGKTVSGAEGWFQHRSQRIHIVDTPGTYSIFSDTAEEAVTGKMLREVRHDLVICVCDATCPVRGLALAAELTASGERVILCMNLMDEARKKHAVPNLDVISERMNIPVIGVTAKKKRSLLPLLNAAADSEIKRHSIQNITHTDALRIANEIYHDASVPISRQSRRDERIDRIVTDSFWKYPIMILLIIMIFWLTMVGANYPSALLSAIFSKICAALHRLSDMIQCPEWFSGALIDGLLRGTGWVISVMLPPMAIFFPLFTLMEDAGLLPRIAFNLDTCCAKCRACGKQALTMAMGFGCNAVGITECRIIKSKRERLIAVLTNALVPCNGRLPALLAIVTVFFAGNDAFSSIRAAFLMTLLILLSIGITLLSSLFLGKTILKGESSSFILELPPYRKPQIGQVILRSVLDRTILVLGRAVKTAAPVSLLIWLLANVSISGHSVLQWLSGFMQPMGTLLGLDGVLLLAFLLGLPANELVLPVALTAYIGNTALTDYDSLYTLRDLLSAHGWTAGTAACFLIMMLFHSPCATALMTIYQETGSRRWTFAAFLIPVCIGIILCLMFTGITQAIFL